MLVTTSTGVARRVVALQLDRPLPPSAVLQRVIRQDETIDALAFSTFGDERLWWQILDANPLLYPLDLAAGDTLAMPTLGPATRITRARSF
jgi:hypothetical protein